MAKTKIIQLPSPTLHKTDEKKVNSNPRKITMKLSTMMMFICHIRSITIVTKMVVIIITPSSAMPVVKEGRYQEIKNLYINLFYAKIKFIHGDTRNTIDGNC